MEVIHRLASFLGLSAIYLYLTGLVLLAGSIGWTSLHRSQEAPTVAAAPRHPDLLRMDAVRKVSGDASMLLVSPITGFGMDEPIACALARRTVERRDLLVSVLKKWDDECALGKMIRQATNPVFLAIVQSQALPPVAVAFDAYVGLEEKWHTLGLFADFDTCTRMRAAAVSLGFGVRSCLAWVPRY